jgi:hypothetical protein
MAGSLPSLRGSFTSQALQAGRSAGAPAARLQNFPAHLRRPLPVPLPEGCIPAGTWLTAPSKRRARGRSAPWPGLCRSGPATLRLLAPPSEGQRPIGTLQPPRKAQPQPPNPPPQSWGRGALTCDAAVTKDASLVSQCNAAPAPARMPARVGLPAHCQGKACAKKFSTVKPYGPHFFAPAPPLPLRHLRCHSGP